MTGVIEQLDELRLAVADAKRRVDEFDAARREGAQRVERARAELMDYYRRQGRGEVSDLPLGPPPEGELIDALREAEGGLTMRPVEYPRGAGQSDIALQAVDEAAEARYAGAVEALEEREVELREYVAANLAEIAVVRAPMAAQVRDATAAVLVEARNVAASYERMRGGWVELLTLADREDLIADIPDNPLRGVQGLEEAVLPMPFSFT